MTHVLTGFEMTAVGEPLRPPERSVAALAPEDVLIAVAGCGVCHTDVGFLYDGVRTRHALPLILGHEISGQVIAAGAAHQELVGQGVVAPAVIPCGECADCRVGRPMICKRQVMPGNDRDGGFASHVVLPGRGLCPVPGATDDFDAPLGRADGPTLRQLSVIADAVSTPYQALVRAELRAGELAVVVGLGGVGGYAVQLARAMGAHVVGIDIDPRRLEAADVGLAIDGRDASPREIRGRVRDWAKSVGAPTTRWTILECSGSAAGQQTAWGLLVHGATLCVVGFTMAKSPLRLSNLMAFDARAVGNWGCDPALYPDLVEMALDGRIDLTGHTELRPLAGVGEALEDAHAHRVERRIVLVP